MTDDLVDPPVFIVDGRRLAALTLQQFEQVRKLEPWSIKFVGPHPCIDVGPAEDSNKEK